MDELIDQLVQQAGIARESAEKAMSVFLSFLKQAGPADKVDEMIAKLPGADKIEVSEGGGFGGMMGAMAAFNSLTAAGLDMGEIQDVAGRFLTFAKKNAGEDLVNDIVDSIPSLRQFM